MDKEELIKKAIIERCNMGIVLLTILDIVTILLLFITFTISITAIICVSVLIIGITSLIILFKKVKKEPLKYKKYFFNLDNEMLTIAQEDEMERRQKLADEINKKYEFKIEDVEFSEQDKIRIEKNCKIMESLKLPYYKDMKLVPIETNTKIKTKEEIICELIFDLFVGRKAKNKLSNISDMEDWNFMQLATKYPIPQMYDALSQISKGEIDLVTLNELAYLNEQVSVLAWALGLKEKPSEIELSKEDEIHTLLENAKDINDIINKCNMKTKEEILELTKENKIIQKFNKDCILEHKKAVDFLTSYNVPVQLKEKEE